MKMLTERTQIAMAMNFGKYPVVAIDVSKKDDYGLVGTKVRIKSKYRDGETHYIRARIRAYSDEKVLTTSSHGIMITDSFTYSDYEEMIDYANAPVIEADQDIVIAFFDSVLRKGYPPVIIRTGKQIANFCSTPLGLEKCDVSEFMEGMDW